MYNKTWKIVDYPPNKKTKSNTFFTGRVWMSSGVSQSEKSDGTAADNFVTFAKQQQGEQAVVGWVMSLEPFGSAQMPCATKITNAP